MHEEVKNHHLYKFSMFKNGFYAKFYTLYNKKCTDFSVIAFKTDLIALYLIYILNIISFNISFKHFTYYFNII